MENIGYHLRSSAPKIDWFNVAWWVLNVALILLLVALVLFLTIRFSKGVTSTTSLKIAEDLTVGKDLDVKGNAHIAGQLKVGQEAKVIPSSVLKPSADSDVAIVVTGGVSMTGSLQVDGDLTASKASFTELDVSGSSVFHNSVVLHEELVLNGPLSGPFAPKDGAPGQNAVGPAQLVVVQKTPGTNEFSSVAAAIASITDASETKPYVVVVQPGVYTEPAIILKPFVGVRGVDRVGTVLTPQFPGHNFIIGTGSTLLATMTITGVTGATALYFADAVQNDFNVVMRADQVSFVSNKTHVEVFSSSKITRLVMSDCMLLGTFVTGLSAVSTGGQIARVAAASMLASTGASTLPTDVFYCSGVGAQIGIFGGECDVSGPSSPFGNGAHVRDGGEMRCLSVLFGKFARAMWSENFGLAPALRGSAIVTKENTLDLVIEHPGTTGSYMGESSVSKTLIDPAVNMTTFTIDPTQAVTSVTGEFRLGPTPAKLSDVSSLIFDTPTMGLIIGGVITVNAGLKVDISAGSGYVAPDPLLSYDISLEWGITTVTLPDNATSYVFVDSVGTFLTSLSQPSFLQNIIFGRVTTGGGAVLWIDQAPWNSEHATNQFIKTNRAAFGPIYVSGSIVTENVGTPLTLDVTQGSYVLDQLTFSPSGGTSVNLLQYFHVGAGAFTTSPTSSKFVDNAFYDNGTTKVALAAGQFTRHFIYVVGDGVREKYLLVYGNDTYATSVLALAGGVSIPPPSFIDGVVIIASVVVQQGNPNIVAITSNRPLIGFNAQTSATTVVHGNLLGLTADDHKQYLLVTGARAMTGDLDMGGNDIINVGAGVVLSLANEGAGAGKVFDAIVGSTANLRSIAAGTGISVTNNATDITIANTGVLALANEGAGAGKVFDATAAGTASLKSIAAGTGITITNNATDINVGITASGATAGTFRLANVTVNTSGQITASTHGGFGNTLMVDAVNGDNAKGARNGHPFLTITAALTAALVGDAVYVYPGTYNETIVMPAGVSLLGMVSNAVIVQKLAVVGATDLVTMADNCEVNGFTMTLTSTAHVQLQGIVFTGTSAALSNVRRVHLTVTSGGGAGTANVYGVHSSGATGAVLDYQTPLDNSTFHITGDGTDVVRGLLCDTAAQFFNPRQTRFVVSGGASAIGVQTNFAGAVCSVFTGRISGTTADISQTLGTIILDATVLINSTANGLGFTNTNIFPTLCWADPGAIGAGTSFMRPGTETSSATEDITITFGQQCIAFRINVVARVAPGGALVDTFTLRKNNANTSVVVTLTGAQTVNTSSANSVTFAQTDRHSMQITRAVGSALNDVAVTVTFY